MADETQYHLQYLERAGYAETLRAKQIGLELKAPPRPWTLSRAAAPRTGAVESRFSDGRLTIFDAKATRWFNRQSALRIFWQG
jgi:hypothetical protein